MSLRKRVAALEAEVAKPACQFCGAMPKHVCNGEVVYFVCGTRPHHLEPATMTCWGGLVMKLKERIEALEGVVGKFI